MALVTYIHTCETKMSIKPPKWRKKRIVGRGSPPILSTGDLQTSNSRHQVCLEDDGEEYPSERLTRTRNRKTRTCTHCCSSLRRRSHILRVVSSSLLLWVTQTREHTHTHRHARASHLVVYSRRELIHNTREVESTAALLPPSPSPPPAAAAARHRCQHLQAAGTKITAPWRVAVSRSPCECVSV